MRNTRKQCLSSSVSRN